MGDTAFTLPPVDYVSQKPVAKAQDLKPASSPGIPWGSAENRQELAQGFQKALSSAKKQPRNKRGQGRKPKVVRAKSSGKLLPDVDFGG